MWLVLSACALRSPSPVAGDLDVDAVVACPSPGAEADRPELEGRLEALGVDGSVETVDAAHLRIRLRKVSEGALQRLLVRGELGFFEVHPWPEVALPAQVWRDGDRVVGERAALLTLSPPPGRRLLVSCVGSCEALLLGETPDLGPVDLAGASVGTDHGLWPVVEVRFTEAGAARFEALTTRLVNHRLAIMLDDEVVSVPKVMEPIRGGTATITFAEGSSPADPAALAAAVGTGPLSCAWTVLSLGAPR